MQHPMLSSHRPKRSRFLLWTLSALLGLSSLACTTDKENSDPGPTVLRPEVQKSGAVPQIPKFPVDSAVKAVPETLPPIELSWKMELTDAIKSAKAENKYLFIDFTASWCKACIELETTTFRDPGVAQLLNSEFVLLKLDVSSQSDADKALMEEFGVAALPALLATQGKVVYLQINRKIGASDLLSHLKNLPTMEP